MLVTFRMTTGLHKLVEAAESVDILKKELELKEQEIKVATDKAEEVKYLLYYYELTILLFLFSRVI